MLYKIGDTFWEDYNHERYFRIVEIIYEVPRRYICNLYESRNDMGLYIVQEVLTEFDIEVHIDLFGMKDQNSRQPPEIPKKKCICTHSFLAKGCTCGGE